MIFSRSWLRWSRDVITTHPAFAEAGGAKVELVKPLSADAIGRIGLGKLLAGDTVDPATLDANYIRRSDAELYTATETLTPCDCAEPFRMTSSQCKGSSSRPPVQRTGRRDQYKELFSSEAPERIVLIAAEESDDATVLGFLIARCLPDEWEIENVVVDASRRRQGIARSLIQELKVAADLAGVSSIILEVRESNLAAVRLYESIGFTREGRRKEYYQSPVEDALLYRLTLRLCDKIP